MSLILVNIWPTQKARGKNFGDVFFDVFRQAEQFSEKISLKYCLGAEILDLSTLFVCDRTVTRRRYPQWNLSTSTCLFVPSV